jgi:hypothetical protein
VLVFSSMSDATSRICTSYGNTKLPRGETEGRNDGIVAKIQAPFGGWEVVPKAEAQQLLTAATTSRVYTRRWKIAHLFGHGWDEGNVRKKMSESKGRGAEKKPLYDVNYPSDGKTVPHLLSFTGTEQHGAGGCDLHCEAQPREVWVMIRLKASGRATSTSSTKPKPRS